MFCSSTVECRLTNCNVTSVSLQSENPGGQNHRDNHQFVRALLKQITCSEATAGNYFEKRRYQSKYLLPKMFCAVFTDCLHENEIQ
jgi:alpha-D-ribose 1-methylphosphonate 5-triphosphate diphosphatase PhnM